MSNQYIPYGRQDITEQDIEAVVEVLRSDFITQGPRIPEFENALAAYCGVAHAVAVNSATSALHIACLALGLGPGDRLWTSPNTFVASANCALFCGAKVDFVDIDPQSYNMSVDRLAEKLAWAKAHDALPKIVVPVHFAGQSCEMKAIRTLADEYGFFVIEDASHAIGGRYLDEPIGGCRYSDVTVFSFHPVKIITTAEGGIATTNNEELYRRMQLYRSHGVTRDPEQIQGDASQGWYYEQVDIGFNYRMTELQAALGCSQLNRLDHYISQRHEIYSRYNRWLADLPLILPQQHKDSYSAFHLYPVQISEDVELDRRKVFDLMREAGIGVNVHYIPVHTQPYYRAMGFRDDDFPVALSYYRQAISIPMYASLTIEQQSRVVEVMHEIFERD